MNVAPIWPCCACGGPLRRGHPTHGVYPCDNCGGMWLDHAATQALRTSQDESVAAVSQKVAAHAPVILQADRPGRCCPLCRNQLEKAQIHDVRIDYCPTHGTWFDRGEIAAVCEAARTGPSVALGVAEVCIGILGLFV